LQHLFEDKQGLSNLYNLKFLYDEQFTDPTEKEIFDKELNRRVNERLFNGIPEKKFLSLESAINKAKEELETLISEKSDYFIIGALIRLQNYIEIKLIGKNLTHYKQSNYYKGYLESIKMTFSK